MSKDKNESLRGEIHKLALAENTNSQKISNIEESIERIEKTIADIDTTVKSTYVDNHRFEPVKLIAYGMAAGIMISVLAALLNLVVFSTKASVIYSAPSEIQKNVKPQQN